MAKKPTKAEKAAAEAAAKAAASRDFLAEAVNATTSGQPLFATETEMHGLLTNPGGPLVEFNKTMTGPNGTIAFRATQLGVQSYQARSQSQPQPQPSAPAWGAPAPTAAPSSPAPAPAASAPASGPKSFTFDTGIPLPAPRRGGRGSTVYGFETMEVGNSFFVAATADNPNPAKRIASTVSSASSRLEPKKFVVRSVDETAQGRGKGARIWRTA